MAAFTNHSSSSTVFPTFTSSSLSSILTSSAFSSAFSSSVSSTRSSTSSFIQSTISPSDTSFEITTSIFTSQDQVVTVTITQTSDLGTITTSNTASSTSSSTSSSSTPTIAGSQSNSSSSTLSTGGKIGIGIGVPLGVVALASLLLLLFLRRKRKARARAARLQEVQDYGFNPNDPSGPYQGGGANGGNANGGYGMSQVDGAGAGALATGYRGWGPDSPNPSGGGSNNQASSVATRSPTAPSAAGFSPLTRPPQHAPTGSDTSAFDLPPPIPPMAPRRSQARNSQQFMGPAAAHARSSSFPLLHPSQTSGSAASSATSGASGTNGNGNANANGENPGRYSPPPVLRNVAARRSMKVENGQNTGIAANF
ncbi:hypothetical protein V1506DRAFT_532067 [Lipomyces tetrasporus]